VRTARIVADRVTLLVEEIRGSLDYYQAQPEASVLDRILLTGGGSRTIGLSTGLEQTLGLSVVDAHPLLGVRVANIGIPEDRLAASEPLITVPMGLALAGRPPEAGVRRISVLPTEVAAVRAQRRQFVLGLAAVGVLALLLLLLWLARMASVRDQQDKAKRAEAQTAALQQQVNALQSVTALDTQLAQRRQLITAALSDDVAWTRLLQEIATVIPNDVWLTSFTGSKAGAAAGTGGTTATPGAVGTVNVTAMGFDHSSAARWLLRVGDLQSLTGLWLPSSSRAGPTGLVTFSSTADLTTAAKSGSDRTSQYLGGAG
jgi:Tfp pilus assembly protein PilN